MKKTLIIIIMLLICSLFIIITDLLSQDLGELRFNKNSENIEMFLNIKLDLVPVKYADGAGADSSIFKWKKLNGWYNVDSLINEHGTSIQGAQQTICLDSYLVSKNMFDVFMEKWLHDFLNNSIRKAMPDTNYFKQGLINVWK